MFRNPYLMFRLRRWWWNLPDWQRANLETLAIVAVAISSGILLGWLAAQDF